VSPAAARTESEHTIPTPRKNAELLGHLSAERAMLNAFRSGRLSHAWLICGPRGIGKATLAFRFARFLLSQASGGPGLFAAGSALPEEPAENLYISPDSPVFHRIAAHAHADLMTVERGFSDAAKTKPRAEIVVDDVRRIGPFLSMTPAEGGWRIVLVDGADLMNRNAMNAVLKVLEEPPPQSLLLLTCHNPGRLLPTVRSRCRMLTLNPLDDDVVSMLLRRLVPETSPEDATELAKLSDGSIGRAVTLAEEGGLELYRDLMDLLGTLPRIDIAALHAFADRLSRPNADNAYRTVTELLLNWLARLIRQGVGAGEGEGKYETALAARLIGQGGLDRWLQVWEKITLLLARADRINLDRKQVILNAVLAIETAARG
jgi:DNA polymerase-3 subunit delta'